MYNMFMTNPTKILIISIIILIAAVPGYFWIFQSESPATPQETSNQQETTAPKELTEKTHPTVLPATPNVSKPTIPSVSFPNVSESPNPSSVGTGPVIVTQGIPKAVAGKPYSVFITASGGGAIYAWKIISGNLPPGINILPSVDCGQSAKSQVCHPGAQISGTPQAAGIYNFNLAVSDGTKAVYKNYSLEVEPADLKITTISLPDAKIGVGYSAEIIGFGGEGSYSWSLVTSNLSPDLDLVTTTCSSAPCQSSAKIVGTPRGAKSYNFTVILNSGSQSTSKSFSITVKQ